MAKNTIPVDVEVDDKGSLKQVARDADKASKNLEKTSKSARTADRNLKGAGQQSSNSTKNFSKMAQGIDGFLVPAYATLAAQMFAVSAAFQFLKTAGDLKQLEAGQLAYTSATGVAMKSLTNDIIAATGAQVQFTEAAQGAAIGTAAGLAPDQLVRLGKAAKDASAVLGRDVTDSFNRLIRGVTKAEPELLDELGVILRLKDASKEYADALGLNENSLTTYQKSQAVVNNVLAQTEAKYSRILAITGGDTANQFAQLGKAFNDVFMDIQRLVGEVAGPLAKVLTETPMLAFAAFGLLLKGPLSAVGVNFDEMAKKARHSSAVQKRAASIAKAAYKSKTMTIESATKALQKQATIAAQARGANASPTLKAASAGVGGLTSQAKANLNKAINAAVKNTKDGAQVASGIFKGLTKQMVVDYQMAMKQMDIAESSKVTKTQVATAKMKSLYASTAATVKMLGAAIMTAGTKLLSILGWVGIAYTIFSLIADSMGLFEKVPSELDKTVDKLKDLKDEYKDFLKVQKELLTGEGIKIGATKGYEAVSNLVGALSNDELKTAQSLYKEVLEIQKSNNDIKAQNLKLSEAKNASTFGNFGHSYGGGAGSAMTAATKPLQKLTEAQELAKYTFDKQIASIEQVRDATGTASSVFDDYIKALRTGTQTDVARAQEAVRELGAELKSLEQANIAATQATDAFYKSFAPVNQAEQAMKALAAEIDLLQSTKVIELLSEGQLKRLEKAKTLLKQITAVNNATRAIERERLALNTKREKLQRNASPLQAKTIANLISQRQLELDMQTTRQEELNILNSVNGDYTKLTESQKHSLSLMQLQKDAQQVKLQGLQDELDLIHQIGKTSKAAFEGGVTSGLKDLITGKESSFRDAVGKIASTTLDAVAGTLSKKMSEGITNFLFGDPSMKVAAAITAAHTEGAAIVSAAIVNAHNGQIVAGSPTGVVDSITGGSEGNTEQLGFFGRISKASSNFMNKIFGGADGTKASVGATLTSGSTVTEFADVNVETRSIFEDFTTSVSDLFSGDAPFLDGLSDVFNSGVDLFSSIFSGLFGGSGEAGFFSSIFGTGAAVAGARYGGVLEGYSTGGIAKGSQKGFPAVLHGTEAVVPLPNGKQIPVEMVGGASGTNNVVVNVSVDNNGNAQTSTEAQSSQDAGKLGQMISQAVQKELQNQKRSGGILNPYGAS